MTYVKKTDSAADAGKIVALYVRVSTGYQVDKDSLPFQKKELKAYCEHVLHIDKKRIEIFEDAGRSAKNTDRPAFQRMMNKVKAGQVSHVIVYKIDRISRNLVDFSLMYDDFKYNRVTFISLNEQFDTSSAIGEAVLKIILVFAELERKLTSERVTDIMIGRATAGQWNGARVPFGWDWDSEAKRPVHSEKEAPYARLMYDMYDQTHSTCKIRDYNNSHDIPTKRGGEWTTKTVSDFLRNPMNKGDYRYNFRESARGRKKPEEEVVYIKGVFPPLVPIEQWDRVNKTLDQNAIKRHQIGYEPQKKYNHVFGGILYCASCGATFHANKDQCRENGFFPSTYRCGSRNKKRTCNAPGITDVKVGPFIFNYISNMVKASNNRKKIKSPEELETVLLSGPAFEKVAGIDTESLKVTFAALHGHTTDNSVSYFPTPLKSTTDVAGASNIESKRQEVAKIERAMERLKKVYLFDDSGMSEKEYLNTRHDLEERLVALKNEIANIEEDSFQTVCSEMDFIKSASSFLLSYKLQSGEQIIYSEFAAAIDDKVLKDFINLVIERIVVQDGRISSIIFKNGLENKFFYR